MNAFSKSLELGILRNEMCALVTISDVNNLKGTKEYPNKTLHYGLCIYQRYIIWVPVRQESPRVVGPEGDNF